MKQIIYNKPEDSVRRSQAKELTFIEENNAVIQLNRALEIAQRVHDIDIDLIQRFVDNYQNLNHHRAYTVGLYATDNPAVIQTILEDENLNKSLFQITY